MYTVMVTGGIGSGKSKLVELLCERGAVSIDLDEINRALISGNAMLISELAARFGEEIQSYGIGSINELFDGDPPHAPWGAVSQAWSVGAVLMIRETTERWRRRRGHGLLPGLRKKR